MDNRLLIASFLVFLLLTLNPVYAQFSIHKEQLEYYNALGHTYPYYQNNNIPKTTGIKTLNRANCSLNKIVFGWHPYWSNGLETNYHWDLLSDLCYFAYEVNPSTGNPNSTHGFSSATVIDDALANGVRVSLCVTLFSNHATFFASNTAQQNLINNLISLCQSRGITGVNLDFEGMSASNSSSFTNFVTNLSTQFKAAIPNGFISICLYAVEWSNVFDCPSLVPYVDLFCIMGYDYYYSGSANAGPTDPLFHFGTSYNYTLSKSVTYYLNDGVPKNKLVLGLPYYGKYWPVSNYTLPAPTTGSGGSVFFSDVKANVNGYYSAGNRHVETVSKSVFYNYSSGGENYQCFITEGEQMRQRLAFIRKRGIAGMGIWALGYDDGYQDFWDAITDNLTDCYTDPCSGTIIDIGGGDQTNYYNNEDYSYTIDPPGATSISVDFQQFSVEQDYDKLYIYDGNSTAAPQVPGSPFSGTSLPNAFTSSGGAITIRFTSDGATVDAGFTATYQCNVVPPETIVLPTTNWKTQDFTQPFSDQTTSNTSLVDRFYSVSGFDGERWKGTASLGFYNDNFDQSTLDTCWHAFSGTWSENSTLLQSDESLSNTNVYAALNQSLSNTFLYHWKGKMGGAGTNRRAGLHIFIDDDPTLPNRGESYFVYFRLDDDLVQFYRVTNDNFNSPMVNVPYTFEENTWYDYKLSYDRISGEVKIFVNNVLVGSWTDPSPIVTGDYVSFRTGNCTYEVKDFSVFRSRNTSASISVGANATNAIHYQNSAPSSAAGMVRSIVVNDIHLLSEVDTLVLNIDWSAPDFQFVRDGNQTADVDTIAGGGGMKASALWQATDTNSGINNFSYSIGTAPNLDDVIAWTTVGADTFVVNVSSTNFTFGDWYYFNVKASNNAGLAQASNSNGFRFVDKLQTKENQMEIPLIYPNPVENRVNIHMQQQMKGITVYDAKGKCVLRLSPNQTMVEIKTSDWAKGMYLLRIQTVNQTTEHRLIKK